MRYHATVFGIDRPRMWVYEIMLKMLFIEDVPNYRERLTAFRLTLTSPKKTYAYDLVLKENFMPYLV